MTRLRVRSTSAYHYEQGVPIGPASKLSRLWQLRLAARDASTRASARIAPPDSMKSRRARGRPVPFPPRTGIFRQILRPGRANRNVNLARFAPVRASLPNAVAVRAGEHGDRDARRGAGKTRGATGLLAGLILACAPLPGAATPINGLPGPVGGVCSVACYGSDGTDIETGITTSSAATTGGNGGNGIDSTTPGVFRRPWWRRRRRDRRRDDQRLGCRAWQRHGQCDRRLGRQRGSAWPRRPRFAGRSGRHRNRGGEHQRRHHRNGRRHAMGGSGGAQRIRAIRTAQPHQGGDANADVSADGSAMPA